MFMILSTVNLYLHSILFMKKCKSLRSKRKKMLRIFKTYVCKLFTLKLPIRVGVRYLVLFLKLE